MTAAAESAPRLGGPAAAPGGTGPDARQADSHSEHARMWEGGGRRKRGRRGDPHAMVPEAEFSSYYGKPIIKAPVWTWDIPAYLFLGGVAGGSSLLAAGADLQGAAGLRRQARATALGAVGLSTYFLIHDLGRPSRFHHMLRVVKPTSPMSVGTWILSAYGPAAGLAAVSELGPLLPRRGVLGLARTVAPYAGSAAGAVAALTAPALASYTAVLLADTSVPTWHASRVELPFVFVGSAAAAAGGAALVANPVGTAGPARRLALLGSVLELAADTVMERRLGLLAEPLHTGRPGTLVRAAKGLTAVGAVVGGVLGRRSRTAAVLGGAALLAGSACTRFGIYYGGVASAKNPKYTVVPQRERVSRGQAVRADREM